MLQSDRLRTLRINHNFTQQRLAELLGVHMRQIPRYEAGEVDPSSEVITQMAKVFNVSADYLLGLADTPYSSIPVADLTVQERRIVAALRRGDLVEAIRIIVSDKS